MATAATPGSSDKVLTDINEQIMLCAICLERFKSPKILPCYHTYCEVCLTEWVKTNNGQLICPTCKELHPLPSGGVQAVTNNRFMNDLFQLIGNVTPNTEKSLCEMCQKEGTFWCKDCGEFFCDDCVRTHKTLRLLKDHKVMTVEVYNEKMSSQHFRMIQPRFCESHPSTQLEFYCDTCQVPTCLKCTVVEHKAPQHDIISIESALEKYMPTMKKYTKTVEQRVNDLKQTKDRVSSDGADLEKMKTTAESQIKDFAKSVFDKLKQQEIKLQAEVSDIYAPKRKKIDSQIELLEHKLVSAESMQSYLNHLLTLGGPVDIMTAKKEMEQRLRQDNLQEVHYADNDHGSDLVFTENLRCLLMDLGHFGANTPQTERNKESIEHIQRKQTQETEVPNSDEVTTDTGSPSLQTQPDSQLHAQPGPKRDKKDKRERREQTRENEVPNSDEVTADTGSPSLQTQPDAQLHAECEGEDFEFIEPIEKEVQEAQEATTVNSIASSTTVSSSPSKPTDAQLQVQMTSLETVFDSVVATLLHQKIPLPEDEVEALVKGVLQDTDVNYKIKDGTTVIKEDLAKLIEVNRKMVAAVQNMADTNPEMGSFEYKNLLEVVGTLKLDKLPMSTRLSILRHVNQNDKLIWQLNADETLLIKGNLENVLKENENLLTIKNQGNQNVSMATQSNSESTMAGQDQEGNSENHGGENFLEKSSNEDEQSDGFEGCSGKQASNNLGEPGAHDTCSSQEGDPSNEMHDEVSDVHEKIKKQARIITLTTSEKVSESNKAQGSSQKVQTGNLDDESKSTHVNVDATTSTPHSGAPKNDEVHSGKEPAANTITESERKGSDSEKSSDRNKSSGTASISKPSDQENEAKKSNDGRQGKVEMSRKNTSQKPGDKKGQSGSNCQDQRPKAPASPTENLQKTVKIKPSEEKVSCEPVIVKNDPQISLYTFTMYKEKINVINRKYKVSVEWDPKINKNVSITSQNESSADDVENAVKEFGALISSITGKLHYRIVDLRGQDVTSDKMKTIRKVVENYERANKLICVTHKKEKVIKLFGEHEKDLDTAVRHLCTTLGFTLSVKSGRVGTSEGAGSDFSHSQAKEATGETSGLADNEDSGSSQGSLPVQTKGQHSELGNETISETKGKQGEREQTGQMERKDIHKGGGDLKNSSTGKLTTPAQTKIAKEGKNDTETQTDKKDKIPEEGISKPDNVSGIVKATKGSGPSGMTQQNTCQAAKDTGALKTCLSFKESYDTLFYFFKYYQDEIDDLMNEHKVDVKWFPKHEREIVYIHPAEDSNPGSAEAAKRSLETLLKIVKKVITRAVINFANAPNLQRQQVKDAEEILGFYKGKVAWYVEPIRKYILLSEDERLLDKAVKLVEAAICIDSKKNQPLKTDLELDNEGIFTDENETLSKKATVGLDILGYIFHVCRDWLNKMESTHGVEFEWSGGEDVVIKPGKGNSKCTQQSLDAVYEEFVTSVQKLHSKMISKDMDLSMKAISSSISQALKDTHRKYSKVLIKETGDKKIRVLGESEDVKVAMETFCSYLGVDVPTSRHGGKGKRHGPRGYGILSTRPSDVGADTLFVGKESPVDGSQNPKGATSGFGGAAGTGEFTGFHVQVKDIATRMWSGVVGGNTPTSKTSPRRAVPKSYSASTSGTSYLVERGNGPQDMDCPICLDKIQNSKELPCKHKFCKACIDKAEKMRGPTCPVCEQAFGCITGIMLKEGSFDGNQYPTGATSSYGGTAGAGEFTGFPGQVKDSTSLWSGVVGGNTPTSKTSPRRAVPKSYSASTSGGVGGNTPTSKTSPRRAVPKSYSASTSGTSYLVERGNDPQDMDCPICLDKIQNSKELPCKHKFCKACIDKAEKTRGPSCPVCKQAFGRITGNMPEGTMRERVERFHLAGYPKCGSFVIDYNFPSGIQGKEHPNPGKRYYGTTRTAYLPDNAEGREVLRLLKIAFDRRLTFTIGTSMTTGVTDTVTWNEINHKTALSGGPFGYPDPDYLKRVKEQLADKGVK